MKIDIFTTENKYDIIYADPPWQYNDKGCGGSAEHHYKTMSNFDLLNLPIKKLAADNCVLFLWATYPFLPVALEVIKNWGFTYKTLAFQWIKLNKSGNGKFFGLGRWTRGNTEPCLLAIKGNPKRINCGISQLIEYPIGVHSAKPPIVRNKIEQLLGLNLRKIELFAREEITGWDCWGDEI